MDSNEKKLDNSLEGAMNMSQEEIERFLAEQENSNEQSGFDDADLASLLSELESNDDSDIQEISNLLNRADNNEAVAEDVVALMNSQESEGTNAYEAMDLFSEGQPEKKEGFIKRLLGKFKKRKSEKKEQHQEEVGSIKADTDNKLDEAITMLEGEASAQETEQTVPEEKKEEKPNPKKKEKKAKKAKKPKPEKKPKANGSDEEDESNKEEKKGKKKVKKEKKVNEKKGKEKKPKAERIREKKPVEDAVELLEEELEEMPNIKKIIMIFVACIMIMLGFLVVNHYYTAHANKQLAEEAYEEKDYLECYQLLYGQKMDDNQTVMFYRSELILKMNIFWNNYNELLKEKKQLESLDELVQFVYEYPELSAYATEWNCLDTVEGTYNTVLDILSESYAVTEQEVLDIAKLQSDVEYTKALVELVEGSQKNVDLELQYPDILPEEQGRLTQN